MSKSKHCPGKDIFQRLNYLYQLSNITLEENKSNIVSALYSNLMLSIAKKSVQRLEPNIKRSLCKKCHSLLVPNVSLKVRIRKKRICWTCTRCTITKSFKAVPNYHLWVEDPSSIVENLKY